MSQSDKIFLSISEAAEILDLPQHVLRFWESKFKQIKPLKRGGNRRFYRQNDLHLLMTIKHLLYTDGFTIKGAQRILKTGGPQIVNAHAMATSKKRHSTKTQAAVDEIQQQFGECLGTVVKRGI